MYVISLVFFGFAVRKYKDHYIPAALSMVLWFLLNAVIARPTDTTMNYIEFLTAAEKLVFTVMTVLLSWLCVLRKKPLRLDWFPLIGTVLAVVLRFAPNHSWKDFLVQLILSAVAVWHIYWLSRPRFIK